MKKIYKVHSKETKLIKIFLIIRTIVDYNEIKKKKSIFRHFLRVTKQKFLNFFIEKFFIISKRFKLMLVNVSTILLFSL